jgi:hypothetical protein
MLETNPPLSPRVCLTLLVPRALEDRVVDWLLAQDDSDIEFSVHAVAARGPLVHLAVNEERVQGYADRVELKLIIEREQLEPLLAEACSLLAGADGGYWVLPVERFAAFGAAAAPSGAAA